MKRKISVLLIIVLSFSGAFFGCSYSKYVSDSFFVFGSNIVCSIDIYSKSAKQGRKAIEEMHNAILTLDDEININKESKLKYFNESAALNEEVEVSKDCYEILNFSKKVFLETGGLFNIAVLPLVKLWKLDPNSNFIDSNDLKEAGTVFPKIEEVNRVKEDCDLSRLILRVEGEKYFISKTGALMIDLGGIAKGYAADMCKEIADQYDFSSMLVNISGNIYLYKKEISGFNEVDWTVYITDPRSKGKFFKDEVCSFSSDGDESVVTSGDYERYYRAAYTLNEEIFVPHIINPVTGIPYSLAYDENTGKYYETGNHITGLTVIADSSMKADALSTASIISGNGGAKDMFSKFDVKGIYFTKDLKFYLSGGIQLVENEATGFKDFERIE